MRLTEVLLAVLIAVAGSGGMLMAAEPPPPAAGREASRTLTTEIVVDVTPEEFWRLLSTPEGVVKLWSVARAEVDLRPDGFIRASYEPEGEGWITHRVLATEPARVLAFSTGAPPNAPDSIRAWCEAGWTVIRLEPAGPGRTRVVESMMGFGPGPLFDEAYAFFEKGNRWTADEMKKKLARGDAGPVEGDRAWSLLKRLSSGGEWIHESRSAGGGVFRVRNVVRPGPGDRSIVFRGWLGGEAGMFPHATGTAWREPGGEVWFSILDERGGRASGRVLSPEADVLDWEWKVLGPDGESSNYAVRFEFAGPDAYRGRIWSVGPGGERTLAVEADYRRVAASPAEFRAERFGTEGERRHDLTIDGTDFVAAGEVEPGIVKEAVFDCPSEAAFRMFASGEAWKRAFDAESAIELRVGGPYEIYFSMEPPPGERGSEGCRVLSYLPGRMLSFSWSAPPAFPKERARRTWVVVTFEPAGDGKTAVRLEHAGFGAGERWPEVRAYFDQAWGRVLEAFASQTSAGAIR